MTPRPGPALDRLRADLRRIDYTTDGVQGFLGPVAAAALHREQPLPAERRCAGGGPLAVVLMLFALGRPVAPEMVERALPSVTVQGLAELGLVDEIAERCSRSGHGCGLLFARRSMHQA